MQALKTLEIINFFEWLNDYNSEDIRNTLVESKTNSKAIYNLKPYVYIYLQETNKNFELNEFGRSIEFYLSNNANEDDKRKLHKYINGLINEPIKSKSKAFKSEEAIEKYRRYLNPDICKCLILPFENDNIIKDFIQKYEIRMNDLSGDLLDIYYSKSKLTESGLITRKRFEKINIPLSKLPCVLIWKTGICNASVISIDGLNEEGLFKLFCVLIDNLDNNPSLGCSNLAKQCQKSVNDIKTNQEYQKLPKQRKEKKFLWNVCVPILTGIVGTVLGSSIVYLLK